MATTVTNAVQSLSVLTALDAERLGIVDVVMRGSSMAQMIPMVEPSHFKEDKFFQKDQLASSQIQTRALNQNYTKTTGNKYSEQVEHTTQVGGSFTIDYKDLEYKPDELDRRVNDFLDDMGFWLDYKIINGDPAANSDGSFPGLKARLTGTQLLDNGGALSISGSAANYRTFMSLFRQAKRRIKPGSGTTLVAVMNETIYEGILKGRDLLGADVLGNGYFDLLNEEIVTLANVPLVQLKTDDIGNEILPMTETSSSSSIYLLAIGGQPAEGSKDIPNGIVALSRGGVYENIEKRGTMYEVTEDYEYGLRVPHRTAARIQLLTQ